ncbi:hypothetical protein NDU88_002101 [Pleurodeles waltl]|uniref:Uncharacterized protein n=1 Tax=Pleurodeles waltl TaxID=8319 RepID=A0AAV7W334_PLEWA|nr:hypothetical protein NDU88_002101 [Pleurodeles waltl]
MAPSRLLGHNFELVLLTPSSPTPIGFPPFLPDLSGPTPQMMDFKAPTSFPEFPASDMDPAKLLNTMFSIFAKASNTSGTPPHSGALFDPSMFIPMAPYGEGPVTPAPAPLTLPPPSEPHSNQYGTVTSLERSRREAQRLNEEEDH